MMPRKRVVSRTVKLTEYTCSVVDPLNKDIDVTTVKLRNPPRKPEKVEQAVKAALPVKYRLLDILETKTVSECLAMDEDKFINSPDTYKIERNKTTEQ